jgi:hypothetical protein
MNRWSLAVVAALTAFGGIGLQAGKPPPHPGVIAASVGESVVLADPDGGWTKEVETGTVGWLYRAPAGVLFAPDLVNGRTTVLDLVGRRVADRFDGVTVPRFGPSPNRYAVVAGDVLVVSYPDRAPMGRISAGIDYPWQVLVPTDTTLLALERGPDGTGQSVITAVDLVTREVVYRRPLAGDVRMMALSERWGLLALADSAAGAVHLVAPSNLLPVISLDTDGAPSCVGFAEEGRTLVAASATDSEGGELRLWVLKKGKGTIKVKKRVDVALGSPPVRLAVSPSGDRIAVGTESAGVAIVDAVARELTGVIELPGTPRDVVWCDPTAPGPILPDWSDEKAPELRLDAPG